MLQLPILTLPRAVPVERERQPQANIPQTRGEREKVKQVVTSYVAHTQPVPPLSQEELRFHAGAVAERYGFDPAYVDYIAVLLNNETWREQLATVPFERRLLMLPKCLRVEDKCPAPFDEFGLLCKRCGLCSIQELQEEAENLGYAVLVAEGSAIVMAIIQTGKIDAIVGVSCLNVLERAFPYMQSAAIPGLAIPLLQDDCRDTTIDLEWIWDVIHLTSDDRTRRLDLDAVRRETESWFTSESLDELLGPAQGETEQIARDWMVRAGKRWRPFLTVCAWKALARAAPDDPLPRPLRDIAMAVECFHKASLIHDDIEDDDARRYGEKALHVEYGVPVALNVGDFLLGEGYRLLAGCDAPPEVRGQMLKIAAEGHRMLCRGQGAELCWARAPKPLTSLEVLEIFRQKTAPAFEVALRLGAAFAGADDEVAEVLSHYSEALGIAYQIRDDLSDLAALDEPDDIAQFRPTLPMAIAFEKAKGEPRARLDQRWRRSGEEEAAAIRDLILTLGARDRCSALLDSYKEEAIRSLTDLENASLKGLLRRVIGKIFSMEVKGWCSEFEARNTGSAVVPTAPSRS